MFCFTLVEPLDKPLYFLSEDTVFVVVVLLQNHYALQEMFPVIELYVICFFLCALRSIISKAQLRVSFCRLCTFESSYFQYRYFLLYVIELLLKSQQLKIIYATNIICFKMRYSLMLELKR